MLNLFNFANVYKLISRVTSSFYGSSLSLYVKLLICSGIELLINCLKTLCHLQLENVTWNCRYKARKEEDMELMRILKTKACFQIAHQVSSLRMMRNI